MWFPKDKKIILFNKLQHKITLNYSTTLGFVEEVLDIENMTYKLSTIIRKDAVQITFVIKMGPSCNFLPYSPKRLRPSSPHFLYHLTLFYTSISTFRSLELIFEILTSETHQ